jgi:hypothetical protein
MRLSIHSHGSALDARRLLIAVQPSNRVTERPITVRPRSRSGAGAGRVVTQLPCLRGLSHCATERRTNPAIMHRGIGFASAPSGIVSELVRNPHQVRASRRKRALRERGPFLSRPPNPLLAPQTCRSVGVRDSDGHHGSILEPPETALPRRIEGQERSMDLKCEGSSRS